MVISTCDFCETRIVRPDGTRQHFDIRFGANAVGLKKKVAGRAMMLSPPDICDSCLTKVATVLGCEYDSSNNILVMK
jgi:hypothetical protein